VSECDREASIIRRPWPTRGCCAVEKKKRKSEKQLYYISQELAGCLFFKMVHDVLESTSR
jgi:hypothetical protein